MIKLFDIENGVLIPTAHCYNLKDLKNIMDSYPDNYMEIYSYIFYMTCPNPDVNPFFDVPEIVWEDQYLDEIHSSLVRLFDLRARFREIQSSLKNIEENLSIFLEVYQHKMSNMLEWIIIGLILIEVIDLFLSKLIK